MLKLNDLSLSAVGAVLHDYGLPLHPLLSEYMFQPLAPEPKKIPLRRRVHQSNVFKGNLKTSRQKKKLPTWFRPFNFELMNHGGSEARSLAR